MRYQTGLMRLGEVLLLLIISVIGTYALVESSLYTLLNDLVARSAPSVSGYLPLIIGGALFVYGTLYCFLHGKGYGFIIAIAGILMAPSLLSYNTINWLGIFGLDAIPTTDIGLFPMLSLGIALMVCYVCLNYLVTFRQEQRTMTERNVDTGDVIVAARNRYLTLAITLAAAILVTGIIAFFAHTLGILAVNPISYVPWNVVFIGLGCVFVLAFFLYWLIARRRKY